MSVCLCIFVDRRAPQSTQDKDKGCVNCVSIQRHEHGHSVTHHLVLPKLKLCVTALTNMHDSAQLHNRSAQLSRSVFWPAEWQSWWT